MFGKFKPGKSVIVILVLALLLVLGSIPGIPSNARAHANAQSSPTILSIGEVLTPPIPSFNPYSPSCNTHLCNVLYDFTFSLNFPPYPFLTPRLAGWSNNANQTVWTLNLRPNLKWSDGSPLNASDMAFTLDLINGTGAFSNPSISNITIMNSTALQLNTSPGNLILYDFIFNGFVILPKETFGHDTSNNYTMDTDTTHIVADGAYVLTNYTSNQNPLILKANPYYWQGAPHFQELYYYQYTSQSAEFNGLQTGEIDAIGCSIPTQCLNVPGYQIIGPPLAIPGHSLGVMFNDWVYPFNNSLVRQALAYATNVTQINSAINGVFAPNASEPQDLLLPAYNQQLFSNATGPVGYNYNVNMSKQLFMKAGFKYSGTTLEYPNGTAVAWDLAYWNTKPWQASAATLVTSQWAEVGIRLQDIATQIQTINGYSTQANPVGWQVQIGEVSSGFANNWGVTPGPGIQLEVGNYEVPVNGTNTFWNSTYAQVYGKLQQDVVNSSQFNADAKQCATMNALEVPVIPIFNIFGNLILKSSISWGSTTQFTGAYNPQSETGPIFWDETLYEATPLSSGTNSTQGGGSTTTVTQLSTVSQVTTVAQTQLTTVVSGGSTIVSTVTTQQATTIVSTATTGTSSSSTLTYVGIGVIVLIIIIAAVVLAMRRRS
jgi:peptide/nickel transport system substrate-binding protein